MTKSLSQLAMSRAMKLFSLNFLLNNMDDVKAVSKDELKEQIEHLASTFVPDNESPLDLTLGDFFEQCIVPAGQSDTQCMYLLAVNEVFLPFVLEAESVPMTTLIEDCSEKEIRQYILANESPYLCANNEEHVAVRRSASKVLFYSFCCPLVVKLLRKHALIKSEEEASILFFGLACMPLSYYRDSDYNFFGDTRLHQGLYDEDEMKELHKGAIQNILKAGCNKGLLLRLCVC